MVMNVKKNDYRKNPKKSDIHTPAWLCNRIFETLFQECMFRSDDFAKSFRILDPCAGDGALTAPWKDFFSDPEVELSCIEYEIKNGQDFLELEELPHEVDLVLCNPPFNGGGGKMLPYEFLKKIRELTREQEQLPLVVLFTPPMLRLNQRCRLKDGISKRVKEMMSWEDFRLGSIFSLPLDVFPDILFHCEILVFNGFFIPPHGFFYPPV